MSTKKKQTEIIPAANEPAMAANEESESTPSAFRQNMWKIVKFLFRLILFAAIITGLGAGVYFGWPIVYERYIRPVEENTARLTELEERQAQTEIELAEVQTRLSALEAGQVSNGTSLADIDSRVQTLESADIIRNESLVELTYQSDLLRAMELLSRARLFLYQSNFGLAKSDVQAARNILADLAAGAAASKQPDLEEAIFRLDLVLKNLPSFPVAASDDLDIAWQVLMDGYPLTATETPVPETTPTATP